MLEPNGSGPSSGEGPWLRDEPPTGDGRPGARESAQVKGSRDVGPPCQQQFQVAIGPQLDLRSCPTGIVSLNSLNRVGGEPTTGDDDQDGDGRVSP